MLQTRSVNEEDRWMNTCRATSAIESWCELADMSTEPPAADTDSVTELIADEPFPDCPELSHVAHITDW